jgi:hypothetical protein
MFTVAYLPENKALSLVVRPQRPVSTGLVKMGGGGGNCIFSAPLHGYRCFHVEASVMQGRRVCQGDPANEQQFRFQKKYDIKGAWKGK